MRNRRRKWRRAAFVAGALVGLYVASYAALYRRGVREADEYEYSYFFYVPFADVEASRDVTLQHTILRPLFAPAERLHGWFGGQESCGGITWSLSREG